MLYEILRAIVGSEVHKLTDAKWVQKAIAWLEEAEGKTQPAKAAAENSEPVPAVADAPDATTQALLDEVAQLRAENEQLRAKEEVQ